MPDSERESYPHPPYEMDFVRVRLSADCRDLGEQSAYRQPPEWYSEPWIAMIEPYHSAAWDGVIGQVQRRLVVDDPAERHPYLVQCLFWGQTVPEWASAWFAADELVQPAHEEIARWIPDPPRVASAA
ncbi:MAG: hypothetical protein JO020_31540 [Chloroflexi bacterium]|nr:hypothetical protein [Chloroflexota bacterium]MBV9898711.1 hypothetical protein [Chloroflexota bacterium]